MERAQPDSHRTLTDRLIAGEPRALARALTIIEQQGPAADALIARLIPAARPVPIVGFTGSPGVGKSTLVASYVSCLRNSGLKVSVAAVDPSSPVTGGALLGDRLRMHRHSEDAGVFIRSVSSRGNTGGLAESLFGITTAMIAGGWDVVVVETVGTGQAEIDIVELADVVVVVTAPGMGDEVQALKSGILEVADILVVNKSDVPGADVAAEQLRAACALRHRGSDVPVVMTSAASGSGVSELSSTVAARYSESSPGGNGRSAERRIQRLLAQRCARAMRRAVLADGEALAGAAASVVRGDSSLEAAVDDLLELICGRGLGRRTVGRETVSPAGVLSGGG